MLNNFFFFFSDLSCEGNSNTEATVRPKQQMAICLNCKMDLKLELIKILVPVVDEKELIHFLRSFKYGNY